MSDTKVAHPPPPRRTQQERSALTQKRILAAAVSCLSELGIEHTSTVAIQKAAGVSRGALLHQFPSKEHLLVAAVRQIGALQFAQLEEQVMPPPGVDRVRHAVETLWASNDGPVFWAAMETWLAARRKQTLRNDVRPSEHELGKAIRQCCDALFGEPIISQPGYPVILDIVLTSMRGVALTYAFEARTPPSDPHVEHWCDLVRNHLDCSTGDTSRPVIRSTSQKSSLRRGRAPER